MKVFGFKSLGTALLAMLVGYVALRLGAAWLEPVAPVALAPAILLPVVRWLWCRGAGGEGLAGRLRLVERLALAILAAYTVAMLGSALFSACLPLLLLMALSMPVVVRVRKYLPKE